MFFIDWFLDMLFYLFSIFINCLGTRSRIELIRYTDDRMWRRTVNREKNQDSSGSTTLIKSDEIK